MALTNGRQGERIAIKGHVRMRHKGSQRYPADILDLSTGGCRVELTRTVQVGDILWIGLPGIESLESHVAWTDGWVAGVQFEHPLHPSVFEVMKTRISGGD